MTNYRTKIDACNICDHKAYITNKINEKINHLKFLHKEEIKIIEKDLKIAKEKVTALETEIVKNKKAKRIFVFKSRYDEHTSGLYIMISVISMAIAAVCFFANALSFLHFAGIFAFFIVGFFFVNYPTTRAI